jgi:[ribosomal protein S5]-alanine N-acetyltransferase
MQNVQQVKINDDYHLSPTTEADKESFIRYLNDPEVFRNTLRVPSPYTMSDAESFVNHCREKREKFGRDMEFRIRITKTGEAIGGISLHGIYGPGSHRDEIGYFIGRPFWGKGIMTQTVKTFCNWVFENHPVIRLEAPIYPFNIASQRVVEKAGFVKEGVLKKMYEKNGEYIDGVMYALLK